MNTGQDMKADTRSSAIARIASEWYALNSDVRRLWVYEGVVADPADARDIHIVVALAPVCDSDDTSPIWFARAPGWQRELQQRIGRRVHLASLDTDTNAIPGVHASERGRVCLASLAWRY